MKPNAKVLLAVMLAWLALCSSGSSLREQQFVFISDSLFKMFPTDTFLFNSFVDCNMATVWAKNTFRIFPGKYGEDPLGGEAYERQSAIGATVDWLFFNEMDGKKSRYLPFHLLDFNKPEKFK